MMAIIIPMAAILRMCKTCNADISAKYQNKRFCDTCAKNRTRERQQVHARKAYRPRPPRQISCIVCSTVITVGRKASTRKYCGKDCAAKVANESRKKYEKLRWQHPAWQNWRKNLNAKSLAYSRSPQGFDRYLRRNYGITADDYWAMHAAQEGVCAIRGCGSDGNTGKQHRRLLPDHCHVTGRVRGLLCNGCNAALGMTKETSVRLRGLADYVDRWTVAKLSIAK